MNLQRLLNFAFAVFVTVGLALAPFAALAAPARSSGISDMSISADMPCCPDKQKSADCQDCPLVAICMLKTMPAGLLTVGGLPLRHPIKTTHSLGDDASVAGLDRPPPDHPPRTLA
jgi:hypothetical protein